ncbi:MAG: hypothetical protein AAF220_03340 [Pseudomonadota bacterium]
MTLPDQIQHGDLKELFSLFYRISGRALEDVIEHPDVKRYSENLFVMEFEKIASRFRYGYVGSEIEHHVGLRMTGLYLDEYRKGKTLLDLERLFFTCATVGVTGFYRSSRIATESRTFTQYERLVCPLPDTDPAIRILLGGFFATQTTEQKAGSEMHFQMVQTVEDAFGDGAKIDDKALSHAVVT